MTSPTADDDVPRLLLTVDEAAKRLSICRSNLFKLIRSGAIESVQIGRLRRITPAALADYVDSLRSGRKHAA